MTPVSAPRNVLPMVILKSSIADLNPLMEPFAFAFIVSAMFLAAPSELSTAPAIFAKSASLALITSRKPVIASVPATVCANSAFCESVIFCIAARNSFSWSLNGFIEPSAFFAENPTCSSARLASPVGVTNRVMIERNAVPAISPLMPAFAIRPVAIATSSSE